MKDKIKHPAKYSDALMPVFDKILPKNGEILDCFAGTGKLRQIRPNAVLLEIEPEWAQINGAIVGDATNMPFDSELFDAVCTSPTYGNRMADSFIDHKPEKQYKRNTYTHCLGRKLSENNSGGMQFGEKYKELHKKAALLFDELDVYLVKLETGYQVVLKKDDEVFTIVEYK